MATLEYLPMYFFLNKPEEDLMGVSLPNNFILKTFSSSLLGDTYFFYKDCLRDPFIGGSLPVFSFSSLPEDLFWMLF